jgi:hypothetical protein
MHFEKRIDNLEKVRVYGDKWAHGGILGKYESTERIDSFLAWSLDTAGPWVLIDPLEKVIITSPGWPGGYIDFETLMASTDIQPVLSRRSEQGKKLLHGPATRRYLSPANPNGTYSFPLQSPFHNIKILGGGCLVQYDKGVVSSYLSRARSFVGDDSPSFEGAMLETASRCTEPVTLMFSGGKDSLAIYLALEEASSEDLSAVYVKQDGLVSGGKFSQARHIASEYGISLTLVEPDGGWAFGDSSTWDRLHDLLTTTLANPVAPHHAVSQGPKNVLVDGQNMDAMLSMDMPKPPQSYPSLKNLMWWARHIMSYLPRSIRYTDLFFRSKIFRRAVRLAEKSAKLALCARGKGTPPLRDTSFRGILKSLMSKELPGSAKSAPKAYAEAKKIEKIIQDDNIREIWFHLYPKMASLFGNAGRPVYHFVNQGPMYNMWENKIDIRDTIEPKKSLKKFVEKKGLKKYSKAMDNLNSSCMTSSSTPNLRVINRYKRMFDVNKSSVVELADPNLKRWIIKELPKMKSAVFSLVKKSNRGEPVDNLLISRAFRYINLELITRESGA